jgi:glucokinase
MAVISLDIGGTKISGAVFSPDGEMLCRQKRFLGDRTGTQVGVLAAEMLLDLMNEAVVNRESMLEVAGISVPGIVFPETGRVWAPNIPGWEDFPLRETISGVTGIPGSAIFIGSDRTCSILGEVWKGAATGCSHALFIAVGTGIGIGILLDGHIIHGKSDIVGAAGWMALEPPYNEKFDACGCFEFYASGNGIGARARDYLLENPGYNGNMRNKIANDITAYDVFSNYGERDPVSIAVMEKAVQMWGMASANLVSLLNPEKVVWGGGIFGPACRFIDDIYREALKWAQPVSIRQVEFVASALGEDAALYGAARLAKTPGLSLGIHENITTKYF